MRRTPIRWHDVEPARLNTELSHMTAVAPDLRWTDQLEDTTGGGWEGTSPLWPFDRERPAGVDEFVRGQRFKLQVRCSAAHPMVVPRIVPLDPSPDLWVRTRQRWHVMGDGSLCLLQEAIEWTGELTASDLVPKSSGWFLEYLLLTQGLIESMSLSGIVTSDQFDHLFSASQPADEVA